MRSKQMWTYNDDYGIRLCPQVILGVTKPGARLTSQSSPKEHIESYG
jgi:hypothetical protein